MSMVTVSYDKLFHTSTPIATSSSTNDLITHFSNTLPTCKCNTGHNASPTYRLHPSHIPGTPSRHDHTVNNCLESANFLSELERHIYHLHYDLVTYQNRPRVSCSVVCQTKHQILVKAPVFESGFVHFALPNRIGRLVPLMETEVHRRLNGRACGGFYYV
jgi:hypothetical protein